MPVSFPIARFDFQSDSIFSDLPESDRQQLQSRMTEMHLKKGQALFTEGTYPSGIYYVKKGKLKKYKTGRDGREQIFYVCSTGELLGYPALLSDEAYPDSAAALEASTVGFIPRDSFLKALQSSPVLSNLLLKNLSHEFGVLVNHIANFSQRSVRERLALALLILREKYRDEASSQPEITLTRQDLSDFVGTAVETLVRLLHDFREEGLVETEGRRIRVIDAKRLLKEANYN